MKRVKDITFHFSEGKGRNKCTFTLTLSKTAVKKFREPKDLVFGDLELTWKVKESTLLLHVVRPLLESKVTFEFEGDFYTGRVYSAWLNVSKSESDSLNLSIVGLNKEEKKTPCRKKKS